jgi:23S rRNA (guanosine2251-2'-O)-methyltransferase
MRKLQVEELNRLSVEDFKETTKFPYSIVLDSIRSMHNVGSVFRTSDAFLVDTIYLTGITATPPHREIAKTALGSENSVNWQYFQDIEVLCQELKAQGHIIVAVEQVENSTSLRDFEVEPNKHYVFVFGNEVFGVNETIVKQADICLEIPQFGTKHSLNIAVSMGVVAWDFVSKQKLI